MPRHVGFAELPRSGGQGRDGLAAGADAGTFLR